MLRLASSPLRKLESSVRPKKNKIDSQVCHSKAPQGHHFSTSLFCLVQLKIVLESRG